MANETESKFTTELFKALNSKKDGVKSMLMSREKYVQLLNEIKEAKNQKSVKTNHQYGLLRKYDVLTCGDVEKIIRRKHMDNDTTLYFVPVEDMYEVIKRAHLATGHGGRDKMLKEVRKRYVNITEEAILLFKSLCVECQRKRKRPTTKGTVVRPICSSDYCSRSQVDLVDMQSMPYGDYKFIMVYQDHLTKFCVLRPLQCKRAALVAFQLLDIFLSYGAPSILHSDNGSEFTADVVTELKLLWPDLTIVHGKPRHPQSQGSVERANSDIKDMLIAWLGENQTQNWATGLKFVQFQKNNSHHSGIKCTPFAALLGSDVKVGLSSSPLPEEVLQRLKTEEDLIAALKNVKTSAATIDNLEENTKHEPLVSVPTSAAMGDTLEENTEQESLVSGEDIYIPVPDTDQHSSCELERSTNSSETSTLPDSVLEIGVIATRRQNIAKRRKLAADSQMAQAERMVKRSRIIMVAGEEGDNVTIPVPLVDRGRGDPRNLLGIIKSRDENDMYKISVKGGMLKGKYSRNQFDLCAHKLLTDENVDCTKEVSLRQAVQFESICGGQGFIKCNCSGRNKCSTNRCKCFKNKVACNSRCHSSLNCSNKN